MLSSLLLLIVAVSAVPPQFRYEQDLDAIHQDMELDDDEVEMRVLRVVGHAQARAQAQARGASAGESYYSSGQHSTYHSPAASHYSSRHHSSRHHSSRHHSSSHSTQVPHSSSHSTHKASTATPNPSSATATSTAIPTTTKSKTTTRPPCSGSSCSRPSLDKIMNSTEVTQYLDTISKLPSGKVQMVKVGDITLITAKPYGGKNVSNARQWPDRPVIWIEAGIEANNFISVSIALNFIDYLINDCKKYCLYDYYVLPFINEKGYAYAKSTDSTWVKTREDVGSGCRGVNLLENFKHGDWASGNPSACSNLYRGFSEMSSPATGYQTLKATNKQYIKLSLTLTNSGNKLSYPYAHSTTKTIPEVDAYKLYLEKYKTAAATSLSAAAYTIDSYATNHGVNHGHPLDYNYEEYGQSFNIAFEKDETKLEALSDEFINGVHAMIKHAKETQRFE